MQKDIQFLKNAGCTVIDCKNIQEIPNSWISLEEIKTLDGINTLHCDTRDFYCMLKSEDNFKKIEIKNTFEEMYNTSKYNISENEVIPWLISIREMSGGNNYSWRMLNFNNVQCENWLKYIRLYRYKTDFIVCNSHNFPIEWRNCTEENLDKEYIENSLM